MINIDNVYSLKVKLGEATTTTAPSVVCSYSIVREKTELGSVSSVESPQITGVNTNGTSEVPILSRTTTGALDNRYRINSIHVANRDTVAHTVYLFIEDAGGTEYYATSGISIAAGTTLTVASDGTISRAPDSGGVLSVAEGGTGATSFTDGAFLIGNGTNAVQSVGPGTAGQIPISQGAGADPIMRTMSGDATLSSAGALTLATYMNFGGRLTLISGTAVTTSDVTAATTVYYTPYIHNRVPIYASSAWTLRTFTERSLALGTITSGRPYDVFIYDSSGTLTLEILAWTSDTARATALTTQDGVYVKSGDATRVYLGTFRTTSTTTTEDSAKSRLLWNAYNREKRRLYATDTTDSWTSTNNGFQNWGTGGSGSTALGVTRVDCICPRPDGADVVELLFAASMLNSSGTNVYSCGIAIDNASTTAATNSADLITAPNASAISTVMSKYGGYPGLGYHYFQMLQRPGAAGTTTMYGDFGVNYLKSAMEGYIWA